MDRKSILIVEDEKILLDLYYSVLTHRNLNNKYTVSTATNAAEALTLAEKTAFDLILTDYHLPGEDGINLIKKIKVLSAPTKYIIISGYLSPHIIQSALAAGADTCLKKPCSIKTILSTIENVLSLQKDDLVFKRQIDEVLEGYVQKALFINPELQIIGANSALQEIFPHSIGENCYKLLYNQKSKCDYCLLAEIARTKTTKTILSPPAHNDNGHSFYNEHIEPWQDSEGKIIGFLISLLPALREPLLNFQEEKVIPKKDEKDFFIFALDRKGAVVFANEWFCNFLEIPALEIRNRPIYEFLHSYFIEYLKKQEIDIIEFIKQNIRKQVKLDFIKQKSHTRHTLLCEFSYTDNSAPEDWEILMVCVNDEKINKLTRLIEFERESSRKLISGQFDMAITLDKEQKIKSISNNFLEKLDAKKSDLIDRDIKELLPKEQDIVAFSRALTQVLTLKDVYNLRLNISYNNKKIFTLVNVSGIRNSFNNEIGYVLILKDIEKNLKMEATLSSIERMQALGQLAAGTAHQINNYTNTIAGSTELLNLLLRENLKKDSPPFKEADDFINLIKASLTRLTGLTKHLTTFARAQQALVISPGDINKVIRDSLALIQSYVYKKALTLKTVFNESLPSIYFSPLHLEQAIINIIMNAIDAVPEKKGIIFIKTYQENNFVCICIQDNGPGIPDEIKDRIFEAFVTTKPAGVGTGLGLNVAKGIVDSIKGTIEIESAKDSGTKMIIKIPILKQEEIV
ncbi:MAG: response regulator [Spirochaetales bacterium]|nr:response regulator [Spirochaetales bacterium]